MARLVIRFKKHHSIFQSKFAINHIKERREDYYNLRCNLYSHGSSFIASPGAIISTVIAILLIGNRGFRVGGDVTAAKGRADGNDYLSLHLRFPGAMCSN